MTSKEQLTYKALENRRDGISKLIRNIKQKQWLGGSSDTEKAGLKVELFLQRQAMKTIKKEMARIEESARSRDVKGCEDFAYEVRPPHHLMCRSNIEPTFIPEKYYLAFCFEGVEAKHLHITHSYFGELTQSQLDGVIAVTKYFIDTNVSAKKVVCFDTEEYFENENGKIRVLKTSQEDLSKPDNIFWMPDLNQYFRNEELAQTKYPFNPHLTTKLFIVEGLIDRVEIVSNVRGTVFVENLWNNNDETVEEDTSGDLDVEDVPHHIPETAKDEFGDSDEDEDERVQTIPKADNEYEEQDESASKEDSTEKPLYGSRYKSRLRRTKM